MSDNNNNEGLFVWEDEIKKVPAEAVEKFKEALFKSKGKTNNKAALMIAQQANSTADDIVRLCQFDGKYEYCSYDDTVRKEALKSIIPSVNGKTQRLYAQAQKAFDPVRERDINKFSKRSYIRSYVSEYNGLGSITDEEARKPLKDTYLGRKLMKLYGDSNKNINKMLKEPMGEYIKGHHKYAPFGYGGYPKHMGIEHNPDKCRRLALLVTRPGIFARPEMSFLNFEKAEAIAGFDRYTRCGKAERYDIFAKTAEGKPLVEHLKYDLDSLEHISDKAVEEWKNLPAPVWGGYARTHKDEDALVSFTGATIGYLFGLNCTDTLYIDSPAPHDWEDKYRVSPLYDGALYDVLDKLGVGLLRTQYRHKGRWNTVHKAVTSKVVDLYQKYEKLTVKAKHQTVSAASAREAIVGVFNEQSKSKAWGVYMFIRDDRELPTEVEQAEQPAEKKAKPATSRAVSKAETVEVEGLGELHTV